MTSAPWRPNRILVSHTLHEGLGEYLLARRPDLEVRAKGQREITAADEEWAEAYVGFWPPAVRPWRAPRWFHCIRAHAAASHAVRRELPDQRGPGAAGGRAGVGRGAGPALACRVRARCLRGRAPAGRLAPLGPGRGHHLTPHLGAHHDPRRGRRLPRLPRRRGGGAHTGAGGGYGARILGSSE